MKILQKFLRKSKNEYVRKGIEAFRLFSVRKKDRRNNTFALYVLGSEQMRLAYADFYKNSGIVDVVEMLTIKKQREDKTLDELTAWELVNFLKSCEMEVWNEEDEGIDGDEEMKDGRGY